MVLKGKLVSQILRSLLFDRKGNRVLLNMAKGTITNHKIVLFNDIINSQKGQSMIY